MQYFSQNMEPHLLMITRLFFHQLLTQLLFMNATLSKGFGIWTDNGQ